MLLCMERKTMLWAVVRVGGGAMPRWRRQGVYVLVSWGSLNLGETEVGVGMDDGGISWGNRLVMVSSASWS